MKPIPEQQARMDRANREIYAELPKSERIARLERMAPARITKREGKP